MKHGLDVQEAALRSGTAPGKGWGIEPEALWGVLGTDDALVPVRSEPGAYPRFYSDVVAAMRGLAPPPVRAHEAIAGLAILESARRSAAERAVITMPGI